MSSQPPTSADTLASPCTNGTTVPLPPGLTATTNGAYAPGAQCTCTVAAPNAFPCRIATCTDRSAARAQVTTPPTVAVPVDRSTVPFGASVILTASGGGGRLPPPTSRPRARPPRAVPRSG